jgi:hypothetical protein
VHPPNTKQLHAALQLQGSGAERKGQDNVVLVFHPALSFATTRMGIRNSPYGVHRLKRILMCAGNCSNIQIHSRGYEKLLIGSNLDIIT